LLKSVAALPRDTIVLVLSIFKDGAGKDFVPADIAQDVARASSAPTYSPYATFVGRGIVGGFSDTFEDIGAQTGQLMLRILSGEDPTLIPPRQSASHAYHVDARQLARWGLREHDLPAGTVVSFKTPGLWEQHRSFVVGVAAALAVMTVLLGALLFQIVRRLRAETRLKDSEQRLGFAAASAGIGLWQYDVKVDRLWSSEHCRAMFGISASDPLTTGALVNAVHPDDRHVALASIRAATFGNLVDGVSEFRVISPNGSVRWLQARGRTELDDKSQPHRVSGIFRDISEHKLAKLETERLSRRVTTIQDEERRRIAQELHDSTAQHLVAVGLNLVALRGSQHRKMFEKILCEVEWSLEKASRELRAFTYLLHPPELARDGFSTTIQQYVEGFSRRTGIAVALAVCASAEGLPAPIQRSLLRIMQEALGNVHRHASATHVSVRLKPRFGRIHLVVRDNGCGMRLPVPPGLGIAGMAARVSQFKGAFNIRSHSTGTAVHAAFPLLSDHAAAAE
jgi:PAS domain S-box-containing protein